jgi:hypothetical protein
MITKKEKLRRLSVRLRTLFKIKKGGRTYYREPSSWAIPNFWYTPFEVYVLAHIKRAHFIMTCDEYAYVDASVDATRYFKRSPYQRQRQNEWETEQFKKRIGAFTERVKKKDEERNENKNN